MNPYYSTTFRLSRINLNKVTSVYDIITTKGPLHLSLELL